MHLNEVLWPHKYLLTMFGMWPMHPNAPLARRRFANFRFIVASLIVISLIVPEIMTVVVYWGDIDILRDFGSLTVVNTLATLKLLYYKYRERSLRSVYQHIKNFWNISDDPQERRHYERPAQVMKVLTIFCWFAGMSDWLSFEAFSLIGIVKSRRAIDESLRQRPLLLDLFYGFDTQRTPNYELIYVWQTIGVFYIVSAIVGCDTTMIVFIVHVSAQFKFIAARFRAIGREIGEQRMMMKDDDDRKLRAKIGKLIAQHQHTIKVTEELSTLLSPMVFGQIVTSGLVICLGGYAIMEGNSNAAYFVKYIILFSTLLLQLFAWCASAEFLIHESISIAEIIYCEVPWFKLKPSLRRDLNLVLLRAQKACYVSALYQVMSLSRITEVFNAAGSYMAMLNSMK